MTSNNFNVILLKAPSEEDSECDPYVRELVSHGIPAVVIPTLEFRFKNLDMLSSRLEHPLKYSGIIVNSPRCAKALIQCFKDIANNELLKNWKNLKCFVVGDATGRILRDNLMMSFEGNDCGNLANLLKHISRIPLKNPCLMPVGNLHKYEDHDVKIEKIEVYETTEHPRLKENLFEILEKDDCSTLISFFSPSGVKSALPYIRQCPKKFMKFIALGPSSAKELENCSLKVNGVCVKPSPESLVDVVKKVAIE